MDLVYDPVAGSMLAKLIEATAPKGTIIIYGPLAPEPTVLPILPAITKSLRFVVYNNFEFAGNEALGFQRDDEAVQRGIQFVFNGLASGQLKPVIDRTFKLDDIVEAHRHMESGQQNEKLWLRFNYQTSGDVSHQNNA